VKDQLSQINQAVETYNSFLAVAKEISKLPSLIMPQYKTAAVDLYEICQKILAANERLSNWLHRFRYFDFRSSGARQEFLKTIQEFKTMETGSGIQGLKFSCRDIRQIYLRDINGKIGSLFANQRKLDEVKFVFDRLTDSDGDMVTFVTVQVVRRIDSFITEVESYVDAGNLSEAEKCRLKFKTETNETAQMLEKFGSDLSELVIKFAEIAGVTLTLN
jgi:hypothetical protein